MPVNRLLPTLIVTLGVALACSGQADPTATPTPPPAFDPAPYPWLTDLVDPPLMTSLEDRFPTPPGSRRVALPADAFGRWLRGLPVDLDRQVVHTFRQRPIAAPAAAVLVLDLGAGDLQQCADTVLRLHAEYLWAAGRARGAAYHFTSGDRSAFADWLTGERFQSAGQGIRRLDGSPRQLTHATYRAWLQHLFIYAGTRSLAMDSRALDPGEAILPGDFFVDPGSPGHAVVVLDVVVDGSGDRLGLVGQGFTPAQNLHVVEMAGEVWLPLPATVDDHLTTPSWRPFARGSARRFTFPG